MDIGDTVRLRRDIPRIGLRTGMRVIVESIKGKGIFEVSGLVRGRKVYVVVIRSWVIEDDKTKR